MGFTPREVRIFQYSQISIIHHINKQNNKNHMIILIDARKATDKIQHSFMVKKKKNTPENGYRGNINKHNKGHI